VEPVDSDDELVKDGHLLIKSIEIVAETSLRAGIVPENIPQRDPPTPALSEFKLVA
jgi:hypothetical protein